MKQRIARKIMSYDNEVKASVPYSLTQVLTAYKRLPKKEARRLLNLRTVNILRPGSWGTLYAPEGAWKF